MTEIDYGRMDALEGALGGRPAIEAARIRGEQLARVRAVSFDFRFDTPGLLAGVPFYQPVAGDILIDAWVEVHEAWDGTTPLADFATFKLNPYGIFNDALQGVPLSVADAEPNKMGVKIGTAPSLSSMQATGGVLSLLKVPAIPSGGSAEQRLDLGDVSVRGFRAVPTRFSGEGPLKLAVSQDGSAGGDDPGATQGSATLHLAIASPQLLNA